MNWYKTLWQRLVDKFVDYWLDIIFVALAGAIIVYARDWLFTPVEMWPIAVVVLIVVIVVWSASLYKKRGKKFKPFPIMDGILNTIWWVQEDPRHWLETTIDPEVPTGYTDGLLDGPYCRTVRQDGEYCLGRFDRKNESTLALRCDTCNTGLFGKSQEEQDGVEYSDVSASRMKLFVIHALQRENRRGRRIKRNFVFHSVGPN